MKPNIDAMSNSLNLYSSERVFTWAWKLDYENMWADTSEIDEATDGNWWVIPGSFFGRHHTVV